jgi:hypothetical protein
MKRILSTITAVLISISAFAGENWMPVAVSEADYQNPAVLDSIGELLCELYGFPVNAEAKAEALSQFSFTLVTNVVGNAAYNVEAGSNWYIAADAISNLLGNNIAQAQAKLDAAKLKPKQGDPLFGEITPKPALWFKEWGVYAEEEPQP